MLFLEVWVGSFCFFFFLHFALRARILFVLFRHGSILYVSDDIFVFERHACV